MVSAKQFRKRNAILSYLRQTDVHPSAEMVYEHLRSGYPDLSLGTVYRNLGIFKAQGLVASLGTVNGVERFDGTVEPHVHFVCGTCGSVLDMPDLEVPEQLCKKVAQTTGGKVESCQLTFTGLCSECCEIQEKGGETA